MTWSSRRLWMWPPVLRHIFILLKTRLLSCRRSRLAFSCVSSLRSFLNTPPQMNQHCCLVIQSHTFPKVSPQQPACALATAQWSFLNGNWQVNHVSVTLFFLSKRRKLWCITILHHLPSSFLGPSLPSCVVLGFCPFHLVFRALNFCGVPLSKVQRQLWFQMVSWASYYDLRVFEKIRHYISVQKSFSLSAIN